MTGAALTTIAILTTNHTALPTAITLLLASPSPVTDWVTLHLLTSPA